jgi:hypothetical protein
MPPVQMQEGGNQDHCVQVWVYISKTGLIFMFNETCGMTHACVMQPPTGKRDQHNTHLRTTSLFRGGDITKNGRGAVASSLVLF